MVKLTEKFSYDDLESLGDEYIMEVVGLIEELENYIAVTQEEFESFVADNLSDADENEDFAEGKKKLTSKARSVISALKAINRKLESLDFYE